MAVNKYNVYHGGTKCKVYHGGSEVNFVYYTSDTPTFVSQIPSNVSPDGFQTFTGQDWEQWYYFMDWGIFESTSGSGWKIHISFSKDAYGEIVFNAKVSRNGTFYDCGVVAGWSSSDVGFDDARITATSYSTCALPGGNEDIAYIAASRRMIQDFAEDTEPACGATEGTSTFSKLDIFYGVNDSLYDDIGWSHGKTNNDFGQGNVNAWIARIEWQPNQGHWGLIWKQ